MTDTPWLDLDADHPFGPHHLPYGIFRTAGRQPSVGVRIGDQVLDVAAAAAGMSWVDVVSGPTLNLLLGAGASTWEEVRNWANDLLTDPARTGEAGSHLHDLSDVTLSLPVAVADYVDFYASENHATNVGRIFRPDGEPLTSNWKHLPIGYHGRASTVVVSGTDIVRPSGQRKGPADTAPSFGPTTRLDIECELGFVVGGSTELGERVTVEDGEAHLFGVALVNDWSARDIQAWEYVPLGPFLGKSFATSMAAWITPLAALDAARVAPHTQEPVPLDYLRGAEGSIFGLDITMEVRLNGEVISRPPYSSMYWSPTQMLAHLTVNGARLSDGDLFASGTVSGRTTHECGSLLEITRNGAEPLTIGKGTSRSFLEDGDTVTITATAPARGGAVVGLAEVSGTIRPGRP